MKHWEYNAKNLTITNKKYGYEIDLESIHDSASCLDWIIQIAHKTWATPEILANLIYTLDELMDIQSNLCSCGNDKKIIAKEIIKKVKKRRNAVEEFKKEMTNG